MSLANNLKKVALITGANKGLGFEVALELAMRNFRVIMADKVDQTVSKEKIICETGNNDIHAYYLDLASLCSVRSFVERLSLDVNCIDVLVNNAGVFCMNKQKTEDCLDAVMQINHLSPFLLTHLMADLLKRSTKGRVIFVSSNGSFFHRLTVEQLSEPYYFLPHFISGAVHYYNTKLCNMIAAKYFAQKYSKFNISSNSVHPLMMNTGFLISKNKNLMGKIEAEISKSLVKYVTRDVKHCADGVIYLADSNQVRNITGKYFINYQVHREPSVVENKTFCDAIFRETKQLVGLNQ